ncbi:MAG: GxxExxY protein [Candidatus Marinimicrobia bacterium]|nr:GxxExxY protein [Candidatus Neomarinimicrobiota bacterium]
MHENDISKIILDLSIKIHKTLGPGLFESVYESIFCYGLVKAGLAVRAQVEIPVSYDGRLFEKGFRADVIVNDIVLVELKSVEKITDIHKKQVLTYLKLTDIKLGLLINFNEKLIRNGFHRVVNNLKEPDA